MLSPSLSAPVHPPGQAHGAILREGLLLFPIILYGWTVKSRQVYFNRRCDEELCLEDICSKESKQQTNILNKEAGCEYVPISLFSCMKESSHGEGNGWSL